MDIKDLIFRYGYVAGRRFYPREKLRFLQGAAKEFLDLGLTVDIKQAKKAQRSAYNLYVGDLKKADIILSTYYDTPPKTFGLIKHKVFDEKTDSKAFKLSVMLPMLLILLIGGGLIHFWLKGVWSDNIFNYKDIIGLIPFLILIYFMYRYRNGIGNSVNLVRNSSSIIACIMLGQSLKKKQAQKLALAFTDYGCVNHFGDQMLREALGESANNKTIIFLDCIGSCEDILILYHRSCRSFAERLKKSTESADSPVHFKEISDEDTLHYNLFKNSLLITSGNPSGEHVQIDKVNTRKDHETHNDQLINIVEILKSLYT